METATFGVDFIVPVHNEAQTVGRVLTQLAEVCERAFETKGQWSIIVVDDGSTDNSAHIVRQSPHDVYQAHEQRLGYGASILTGIGFGQQPWIGLLDADGTYGTSAIGQLIQQARDGSADQVIGHRCDGRRGAYRIKRLGRYGVRQYARLITGFPILDLNSGLRLIRRACLQQVTMELPLGFSASSTLTLLGYYAGHRIVYVPVRYYERRGMSKLQAVPEFFRFLRLIHRLHQRYAYTQPVWP